MRTRCLLGMLALMLAMPSTVRALDTTEQLSFLLFHERYSVTQTYLNYSTINPTWDKKHAGIDFGTGFGKTIYAPISGECVRAGGDCGYCSIYSATLNRTVIFLHMSEVNVSKGDRVYVGQVLGKTGDKSCDPKKKMTAHAHIECRPGNSPNAVGTTIKKSTASQTMSPLTAFADQSVGGTVELQRFRLDANNEWYRIFDLELFWPGELTAIAKNSGTLDADLWYSWDGSHWYYLSNNNGNEFVHFTLGSGYGTDHSNIYIAVVAHSGAGDCDFMWHSTQSAP